MPELPEVETVVRTIRPRLIGARVKSATLHRADVCCPADIDLPRQLKGRTVADVARRAKRIVFTLDDGNRFYVHLGMTGRLMLCPCADEVIKHTHLVIDLAATPPLQLRFIDPRRFGGIWWLGAASHELNLGPEPLRIRAATLVQRLAKTARPIKSALLDQALIAGLGNIYVDESLFLAGVHPLKHADRLKRDDVERLTRSIKTVLKRAIRAGGSTIRDYVNADGARGGYQHRHNVYDRAGQPCRRCKTPIERIVLSGRSTHFCPICQGKR